jgi:hypothetical protein
MKALLVAGVALTVVAVASAAPGEPRKVLLPAVQAKAKAINVRLSDLPAAGWKTAPQSPNGAVPTCSFFEPKLSDLTENGDADSPEFKLPSSSYVSSSTGIFVSASQAATAYSRVVQPALPRCLAEIFTKGLPPGFRATIVFAGPLQFSKLASRTNAFRIRADIKARYETVHTYIDLVVLLKGKVETVIFFAGITSPFKASFEQGVAGKVAARMASA